MGQQLVTEQFRIEKGETNRKDLMAKYDLDRDPAKFQELRTFGQEVIHGCVDQLKQAQSPVEFGKVIDKDVVMRLQQRFNMGGDDYGDRAARAYLERFGTKASYEIGIGLETLGVDNEVTRRSLDLLPLATSGEQIGVYINEILMSDPKLQSQAQVLFELSRDQKIEEFEMYYQKENSR